MHLEGDAVTANESLSRQRQRRVDALWDVDGSEFCKPLLKPLEYEAFTLHRRTDPEMGYGEIAVVQGFDHRTSVVRLVKRAEKKLQDARGQKLGVPDAAPASVIEARPVRRRAVAQREPKGSQGDDGNLRGAPCYVQVGGRVVMPGGGAIRGTRPDQLRDVA